MGTRRKTDAHARRERIGIALFSAFILVFGLTLPFLPGLTAVEYQRLSEKEITVESLKLINMLPTASYFRITADNGERYSVSGDYTAAELWDSLRSGAKARIKYHENRFLLIKYAEEVSVDGKCVVRYNDDQAPHPLLYLFGGFCALLGGLGLLYVKWSAARSRRMRESRDRRIIKKYGSLKKDRTKSKP